MGFCLGFSNTSNVDSLDRFSKEVVEKVYIDLDNLKGGSSQEEKNKLEHANELIHRIVSGGHTTCVYQLISDK